MLPRIGGEDYPTLEDFTGQAAKAPAPSPTILAHKLRLWTATLSPERLQTID